MIFIYSMGLTLGRGVSANTLRREHRSGCVIRVVGNHEADVEHR